MPPPFRKITIEQFATLLQEFPFTRNVDAVHMHHTWRPNRAQFKGHETIVGMWRFHTVQNKWRDIAQHLTIDPEGGLWLGRSWNLAPVSATGNNGTSAAGPFMFEMIGDFDTGKEPFDGAQKEAALKVCALVLDRFDLPTSALRFHRQMAQKSCPGTGISYEQTLRDIDDRRSRAVSGQEGFGFESVPVGPEGPAGPAGAGPSGEPEILFGEEGEPPGASDQSAPAEEGVILFGDEGEEDGGPAAAISAPAVAAGPAEPSAQGLKIQDLKTQDLIVSLLREEGAASEAAWAEPHEKEGPPEISGSDVGAFSAQEGIFGGPTVTTEIKEALRPHVINLTRGRLSTGGLFSTTEDDLERIFDEDLERAVAGHGLGNPLRIVIWAHGGLTDESGGLLGAYRKVLWWNRNGVYPLFFVWETGLFEALGRVIGGSAETVTTESILDRATEFTDRRVETLARALGGVEVWGDMKESAVIAAGPEGGSTLAARKLSGFCARHPGAVELHAVGHSAGSIFHGSFLNAAKQAGVPAFENLFLLAPAIRVDEFHRLLAPLLGPNRYVRRTPVFTMSKLRELDDTCVRVYQKSLLYLIYYALEPKKEEPILGLEISLRADPKLRGLFGLAGAPAGAASMGEVVWSKTPAAAPPRSRTASLTHGGFDDDALTLDSLLRRVLGRDDIPFSFSKAEALTPDNAVPGGAEAVAVAGGAAAGGGGGLGFVPGEEGVAEAAEEEEEEVFDSPFDVVDAFERAAELAPDELGDGAFVPELGSLETPAGVSIAFGPNAKQESVTPFSRQVLTSILQKAGLSRVVITSTSRNASEQARVMFQNLEKFGVAHQKKLYGPSGDQVIEVYRQAKAAGKPATAIRELMMQEILRIGPTRVSRHASDPKVLNVFDVAPSSVANQAAFEKAVRAEPRVAKFLIPPNDPGYHLEIPQPKT
ncbi:MAG TPA: peptidoglycan recognition family protein [Thermoanaerobaculia bacterium]|nr:peptidoglycan recognition family protein [Thermoanaerobaculia bacterium]